MKVIPRDAAAVGAPQANETEGHDASHVATKGKNTPGLTDGVV